jgi:hypothetical protein
VICLEEVVRMGEKERGEGNDDKEKKERKKKKEKNGIKG